MSEVIDNVKENPNKLVDARTREIEDRTRRDNNMVLFNLSENMSHNGEENERWNETKLKNLSTKIET